MGCTPQTLRKWVRQTERYNGKRSGLTTDERLLLRELEREVRELRRANDILSKASAYLAQAEARPPTEVWWLSSTPTATSTPRQRHARARTVRLPTWRRSARRRCVDLRVRADRSVDVLRAPGAAA